MDYLIEVQIAETVDDITKERIRKNLNENTLRMPVFPKPTMQLGLLDGTIVIFEKILVLQKKELSPDAIAVISPLS